MLIALAPLVAAEENHSLELPSSQVAPLELSLVPTAPTSWRMPIDLRPTGAPPLKPGGIPIPPVPALGPLHSDVYTKDIPFGDPADHAWDPIPAPAFIPRTSAGDVAPLIPSGADSPVRLDPFVVRGDRFRHAQEAIDSTAVSDGRFSLATGGRIAKFTMGPFSLEFGVWKHETAGPSFGPPMPVVDLIRIP